MYVNDTTGEREREREILFWDAETPPTYHNRALKKIKVLFDTSSNKKSKHVGDKEEFIAMNVFFFPTH